MLPLFSVTLSGRIYLKLIVNVSMPHSMGLNTLRICPTQGHSHTGISSTCQRLLSRRKSQRDEIIPSYPHRSSEPQTERPVRNGEPNTPHRAPDCRTPRTPTRKTPFNTSTVLTNSALFNCSPPDIPKLQQSLPYLIFGHCVFLIKDQAIQHFQIPTTAPQ